MKTVIITDLHLGVSNFSPLMLDEADKFLEFVTKSISSRDMIVINGDTLDNRRVINIKVINLLKKWLDLWYDMGANIICNLGNHDTRYDGQTDDTMLDLFPDRMRIIREPTKLNLIPGVNAVVVPYFSDKKDLPRALGMIRDEKVVFTHAAISDKSLLRPEYFSGIVLNGHIHTRSTHKQITNLGTGFQMSWNDVGQIKGFHTLDETGVKFHEYQHTIFKIIRLVDGKIDGVHPLKWLSENKSSLKDHFIKVYVDGRMDRTAFGKFCDVMGNVDLYEVKYSETLQYDYTTTDEGNKSTILDAMYASDSWESDEKKIIDKLYARAMK